MAEILGGCKCQGHDVDKFDISKLKGPDDTAARLLEGDCGLQEGQGKKSHADMKETHQRLKGTSSPGEKEKEVEKLGDGTQPDGKANSLGLRLHCQGWIILVVPASMGTVYLSSMLAIL